MSTKRIKDIAAKLHPPRVNRVKYLATLRKMVPSARLHQKGHEVDSECFCNQTAWPSSTDAFPRRKLLAAAYRV
jgi:hypothetical protein